MSIQEAITENGHQVLINKKANSAPDISFACAASDCFAIVNASTDDTLNIQGNQSNITCAETSNSVYPASISSERSFISMGVANLESYTKKSVGYSAKSFSSEAADSAELENVKVYALHEENASELSKSCRNAVSSSFCGSEIVKQNASKNVSIADSFDQQGPYKCFVCPTTCNNKVNLLEHIKEHQVNRSGFACRYCSFTTHKSSILLRHISCIHQIEQPAQCPICDFSSFLDSELVNHIVTVHEDTPNNNTTGASSEVTSSNVTYDPLNVSTDVTNNENIPTPSLSNATNEGCPCDNLPLEHNSNSISAKFFKSDGPNGPTFKCSQCSYVTSQRKRVLLHYYRAHKHAVKSAKRSPSAESIATPDSIQTVPTPVTLRSRTKLKHVNSSKYKFRYSTVSGPLSRSGPRCVKLRCHLCQYTADRQVQVINHIANIHSELNTNEECEKFYALQSTLKLPLKYYESPEYISDSQSNVTHKKNCANHSRAAENVSVESDTNRVSKYDDESNSALSNTANFNDDNENIPDMKNGELRANNITANTDDLEVKCVGDVGGFTDISSVITKKCQSQQENGQKKSSSDRILNTAEYEAENDSTEDLGAVENLTMDASCNKSYISEKAACNTENYLQNSNKINSDGPTSEFTENVQNDAATKVVCGIKLKVMTKTSHDKVPILPEVIATENTGKKGFYSCTVCNFKAMRERCLSEHQKVHVDEEGFTKCFRCEFRSNRIHNVTRHERCAIEKGARLLKCDYCDYTSCNFFQIARHMQNREYRCPKCEFKTAKKAVFHRHCRSHTKSAVSKTEGIVTRKTITDLDQASTSGCKPPTLDGEASSLNNKESTLDDTTGLCPSGVSETNGAHTLSDAKTTLKVYRKRGRIKRQFSPFYCDYCSMKMLRHPM